jgi:tungstate transport system ATP-binding protein
LGLIGPTGSGKTSLLRLINMIDDPSSGNINYKGKNIKQIKNLLELKRKITMVFQKPIVFKGTVFDNVYYGLNIGGKEKEESIENILNILKNVGLKGYQDQDASTLSGGEIQRVALARALIIEPEILLLDEPTANLDPNSTEKIEKVIENIQKNRDIAIVMSTHNLIQGQRLCDEIAIINKKIFQMGKSEEIFRRPKNKFVAKFVGMKNIIEGKATFQRIATEISENITLIKVNDLDIVSSNRTESEDVYISIRPEDITITRTEVNDDKLNQFKGKIISYKDNGALTELKVNVDGNNFIAYLTRKNFFDLKIKMDSDVWLQFKRSSVHIFNKYSDNVNSSI